MRVSDGSWAIAPRVAQTSQERRIVIKFATFAVECYASYVFNQNRAAEVPGGRRVRAGSASRVHPPDVAESTS
jgi:hypothetical protein